MKNSKGSVEANPMVILMKDLIFFKLFL